MENKFSLEYKSKGDKFFQLAPFSFSTCNSLLLSFLHATRYAKGGAESSEYGDEKLDDVLPNVFVDSHSGINLMYN